MRSHSIPTNCLKPAAAFVVVALALATTGVVGCDRSTAPERFKPRMPRVKIIFDKPGAGSEAKDGRTVLAHYVGRLESGKEILNTHDMGGPQAFRLGDAGVIAGMEDAVRGMRAGGRRIVEIPPELHWGRGGYASVIPEHEHLTFEIELIEVK